MEEKCAALRAFCAFEADFISLAQNEAPCVWLQISSPAPDQKSQFFLFTVYSLYTQLALTFRLNSRSWHASTSAGMFLIDC
jgi:hypothetical protein